MSKTDELISKLEEGNNPEPLKHAVERLKKDAIKSQIGYIFPNEHYIECSGIIMACDQILEWIESEISSLKEQIKKEVTLPGDVKEKINGLIHEKCDSFCSDSESRFVFRFKEIEFMELIDELSQIK
jgi:hypothetical protein